MPHTHDCESTFKNHKLFTNGYLNLLFLLTGSLLAIPAMAQVVINEIDYDQPGTDTTEFVELKNTGGSSVDLSTFTLEFFNGSTDSVYDTIVLSGSLAAGDYFVVCANAATVTNCDLDDGPDTNFIQNGAPDAMALRDGGVVVDAVSYEGVSTAPYAEGTSAPTDSSDGSISRFPDGMDTDDNGADFVFCVSTPGSTNCVAVDAAPEVSSTLPADGATGIAVSDNIQINFSEDVVVAGAWYNIDCTVSGVHTAVFGGGPQSYLIDPDTDFVLNEVCTVDIFAAQVTDSDSDDPPDNMDADFQFSFDTIPFVAPDLVINEIHADPDSTNGDANGDGTAQFSQDEFVEIVNNGAGDLDISGWTLADGFTVRHTFPAGSVIAQGCAMVVFGGGTPTGPFGGSVVQTATGGQLGLNNGGDSVTLNNGAVDVLSTSYGSEGGDNQSLTLDPDVTGAPPYVKHTVATGSGGSRFSPGTKIDGSRFDGCPTGIVINELHADPAGDISGDANGDGVRNSGQDEFVEIVNNTGSDIDMSGWTLADGFTVRHTFPSGSVVFNGCSAVVFGGGTPTGAFGNSLVQTASGGSLGLNNGGDSITINNGVKDMASTTYGGEGGDNQSLTLDPDVSGNAYVKHSVATGSGGSLYSPGTRIDGTQFDGCPVAAEIFEIQGSGLASPFTGMLVLTEDNIVTAVGTDGFFIQTPDVRADADINTSNGIFVFTGSAPTVAEGDQVDVLGNVSEFFDFTEFSAGAMVNVDSSGNSLPAITIFDATVPSPDPMAPSCSIEYECYEGMLVEIIDGTVTGPNQRFNPDPIAEVHITAASERTFREPGIEFPGIFPFPEWDGNPEVFELDPDKLGLPNQIIPAGSSFSATGVIGFEFGGYELWPVTLNVTPAALPVAVRSREVAEMTVGALNLFRLFNDVDDGNNETVVSAAEYARRLTKFSQYIRDVLDAPDILAVSEVESQSVLQDLADVINVDDASIAYTAYLVEGNDVGGIDVGFLVLNTVDVDAVTQLGAGEIHTYDGSLLNDRPPLLLEGRQIADGSDFPIAVIAIHGRSLGGIDTPGPGNGERVRQKRYEQAQYVASQVQLLQDANPDINLVVTGDFNAFEFSDSYVDVTGHMKGDFTPADNLVCTVFGNTCDDLVNPNMLNQMLMIDAAERYSFNFRGNAQALDQTLTSSGLDELIRDFQIGRGNSDAAVDLINDDSTALRSSDHDGLVLFVKKDSDGDGVTDDADYCPGTMIPEGAPTRELRTNNFALVDDNRQFDTKDPQGVGPMQSFDIFDTAGCSCEQIVVEAGLGKGHLMFGCSIGEMEDWVDWVNQP